VLETNTFKKGYYHGSSLDLTFSHVIVNIHLEGAILVHSEEAILVHWKEPYWHIRKEPPTVRLQVEYKTGNLPQSEF
jgi:hypothetical protein